MVIHQTRTKIVATIGPACESVEALVKLIHGGLRVARLNFSHGTHESHGQFIKNIRAAAAKTGIPVAILQDLQGPRIRVGNLPEAGVSLSSGSKVAFVPESKHRDQLAGYKTIPIQYEELYQDVRKGDVILIEDGKIQVKVLSVRGMVIYGKAIVPGVVKTHKGINVPGVTLTASVITTKDKADIAFGQKQGVHFVALSFVKEAKDIKHLRSLIEQHQTKKDGVSSGIIAKIERREALENLDEIVAEADGIMVARGDLGLEIPAQEVPLWQKEMIHRCLHAAKPVIVATQMLESMVYNPQPTRAEVSDVANAIIDHTDAVMLSGESATGKYPTQAVEMMTKIAVATEGSGFDAYGCGPFSTKGRRQSLALSACELSKHVGAKGIIVATRTGESARVLSRHRPELPIIALTKDDMVYHQLSLTWGAVPVLVEARANLKKMISKGLDELYEQGYVHNGDFVIAIGSEPFGKVNEINAIQVIRVGEEF